MSCTTMHRVPKVGGIEDLQEYRNSHRSASMWWQVLAEHYRPGPDDKLNRPGFDYIRDCFLPFGDGMDKVWKLYLHPDVKPHHRAVIALTFDQAVVSFDSIPDVSRCLTEFIKDFGTENTGHAANIATDLMKMHLLESPLHTAGVCFTWTSVASDVWERKQDKVDEDGEEVWSPFDISKDKDYFLLWEDLVEKKLV